LKKQSQFNSGQIDVSSYLKAIYGNKPPSRLEKNKAKQTQFDIFEGFLQSMAKK